MFFIRQLWRFAYQQALSCLFPVFIFGTLALSKVISIPYLPRYDFILLACILLQFLLLLTGYETKQELKVICLFHIIGLGLEIFKVHAGSWSYPEEAYAKCLGVPLYSGFMYASVASYMCQAWKRMQLFLINYPNLLISLIVGICIYANFFTHHYVYDFRWVLVFLLFVVYFTCTVSFQIGKYRYRMPLIVSFFLIGFFIWIAENIATFFGAWQYPNQSMQWEVVHMGKISSWFLLVIVSFILVAYVKERPIDKRESTYGGKHTITRA
ncbi:DUF817 domain-containing protein [Bacillus sp. 165]|uniref:DUF817 domain-containing protein n=1 Tax=Bacillus sp. 165 TaxID=1529117 RepID=UPI001ADA5A79|nr:DUF817 domain-containing protein [Bacillus sp. 165]MBO9128605.1 DUF817 domain-containing protein [Bacillus sp. 165]